LIISLIIAILIVLAIRVFDLCILDQHFLRHEGDQRVLRLVRVPAFRGMIFDRHSHPLAVSARVSSIWMNPQEVVLTESKLTSLASLLQLKKKELIARLQVTKKKHREFVYLKRGLSPNRAERIKALAIPGVYVQHEYRRYYSEGEVTAQLLGLTNVDDQGQEGLELAYNTWLEGEPGKKWVVKDRLGRIISNVQTVKEQKPGQDLVLSIDKRIQYLAYRELLAGVLENKAKSGSVIVLDVETGEILAMVNQPSFNPNNRKERPKENIRNRAVTDIFEPGSTIKAFSIASALDSGQFHSDSLIDTHPGWIRVGKNRVKDEHNNGLVTVRQILEKSSNVGTTKMILDLPPNQLWNVLHRVGFGELTGVQFPGEQGGSLTKHEPWGDFVLATLSWGYGISVNALQLARAYAVIANHGVKVPVTLLKIDKAPQGDQVMRSETTQQMLELLESVVAQPGGTGKLARINGYRVAGKTGTSILAGKGGYQKNHYISSFVGMAPLSHPKLVVAVVIHEPQGKQYHGGTVAGPVFQKIMESSLRMLNIPPDAA